MKAELLVLAFALTSYAGGVPAAEGAASPDRREVVELDAAGRAGLLAEMRGHLVNVQAVLAALAKGDSAAAANAARASGITSASEAGDDMMRRLPRAFTSLGMSMHEDFDRLADSAARGNDTPALVGTLAAIMQKCVACHSSYRLRIRTLPAPKP